MAKSKYIVYFVVAFLVITCLPQSVAAFSDTRQHWARPQIDHLESRELINGYPDGGYHPESYITREEFITLVIRVLNKEEEAGQLMKGESFFKDVHNQSWAKGYIEVARELNITSGDGWGNFQPMKPVSREEAITMLVKSLGDVPEDTYPFAYSDNDQISAWAWETVSYASREGLIHGYPDGTFRPRQNLTRAEVTVLLEDYLDLKGQKFHFFGTLESIDLPLRQAVFLINGKEEIFELSNNIVAYKEGSLQPVSELSLPAKAYFDVDKAGDLSYLFLVENYSGETVKIRFSSLPSSSRLDREKNEIVKLAEEDEELPAREASGSEIANSLAVTRAAMHADEFSKLTGATGRGQLVAVIDSGIDPGHPDLQTTTDGFVKIVDFIDLSNEGKVDLNRTVKAVDNYVRIDGKKVDVNGIENADEFFAYGYLSTDYLPLEFKESLPGKRFLVVAVASSYFGLYDTVYVDTDMDGEILDETPVKKYSDLNQVLSIQGDGDKQFNLVVSKFSNEEHYVKFGFDALGHGTEIAGIIAANGKIEGIAPGAQLLPVKVMNGTGKALLDNLVEAVRIAAERGAGVAVMSMGQYQISIEEQQRLGVLAGELWKKSGMILCMAAGNNGPGLGTVASTSAIQNLISVGAYATPEMWYNDYGWRIERPTLWYFSSAGPAIDGLTAPVVVAPGSVISTYPMWGDWMYRLDEGTSMAAPHVAGAAALLMDASLHELYRTDLHAIYRALISGAEPLPGVKPAEQGYGAVNLMRAWEELKAAPGETGFLEVKQYSPGYGYGKGFYSRELKPGELSLEIINNTDENKEIAVGGLSSWIKPQQFTVQVPGQSRRTIDISYDDPGEAGLYSSFLVGDDHNTPGWELAALQTFIIPYYLQQLPSKQFQEQHELDAGQFKRYFFYVPEGTGTLDLRLKVGNNGRARMHIISPEGRQDVSQYAGTGKVQVNPEVEMSYVKPAAGTWEVVVYSSLTLSTYDLNATRYTLDASISGKNNFPAQPADKKYLVSVLPKKFDVNEKNFISLYFWNPVSKMPATGAVTINGKVYEIKNGLVQMQVVPENEVLYLNIAW